MKQIRIFLLFMLSTLICIHAQTKISGVIRDAESSELLTGASIIIEKTNNGTTTNEKGFYELTIANNGEEVIKVSFIGYETLTKSFNIQNEKELKLNFDLYKKEIPFNQVVVTASRTKQEIGDVPGRISVISNRSINASVNNNVDDLFKMVSGVNIDRASGMFSQATVNVRGVASGEQGRVLALIDGLPINKTDGGSVNWNRIDPDGVERIEIFKGPGSSVYGNNAMGGVINIISKKPSKEGYQGFAELNYGTYNTFQQKLGVYGKLDETNGLYFRLSAFNRNSDGYNSTRELYRDQFSTDSELKEKGFDGKVGYELNDKTNFEVNYNYADNKTGSGTTVKEENYQRYKTNYSSLKFNTKFSDIELNMNVFFQHENYLKTMEKYKLKNNSLSSYDLIYVDADRDDYGTNANVTIPIADNNITAGVEAKIGSIDGADNYKTSTDIIANKGKMLFLSGFVQDEVQLIDALKMFAGIRIDNVKFKDGEFTLINPTSASSYMQVVSGPLKEYDWTSVTPKISLQYRFTEDIKAYGAYSQGFRAASLDDLTRSGLIKLGFKLANPELKPEKIENFEAGLNYSPSRNFYITPSLYYMVGKDFMYYISTGQTINISGKSKSIIKKDNITKVKFLGADVDVKYFFNTNLYSFANYTYTKTEILNYTGNTSLEGKELTYTPDHTVNIGITYMNPIVNGSVNLHYQGKQYLNDDNSTTDSSGNTAIIGSTTTMDIKLWKKLFNLVKISFDVQNVFNEQDLTTYDRISLGRMITAGVSVEL